MRDGEGLYEKWDEGITGRNRERGKHNQDALSEKRIYFQQKDKRGILLIYY